MLVRECFRRSSQASENGFVEMAYRFAAAEGTKPVHRSAKREWLGDYVSNMDPSNRSAGVIGCRRGQRTGAGLPAPQISTASLDESESQQA